MRVAAGPIAELQQLEAPETFKRIKRKIELERQLASQKQLVCDMLFEHIKLASNQQLYQKNLLNLKRDIFNLRKFDHPKNLEIIAALPAELRNALATLESLVKTRDDWSQAVDRLFNSELNQAHSVLKNLARNPSLQKGLVLSSQSLLQNVNEFIARTEMPSRRAFQTIESLMKYLSRTYAKTSPFSTFTHLSLGNLSDNQNSFIEFASDIISASQSHVRLNNFLFQYLHGLLIKHPEIRKKIWLRLNPTLMKDGTDYRFLTNHNNVEAFQKIEAIPVIEVFVYLCMQRPEGISYEDLVQTILLEEYIDAPVEEIEGFLDELINFGLLEFDLRVSGIDPDWDERLTGQLHFLQNPLAVELISSLKNIRKKAEEFAQTNDVKHRYELLKRTHEEFKNICKKIYISAGLDEKAFEPVTPALSSKQEKEKTENGDNELQEKNENGEEVFQRVISTVFRFKPEQMYYEDSSLIPKFSVRMDVIADKIQSLNVLLETLSLFEGRMDEFDIMTNYFAKKYGDEASVNLITFYEDFYRDYKKPEAERQDRLKNQHYRQFLKDQTITPKEEKTKEEIKEEKIDDVSPAMIISEIDERNKLRKLWQEALGQRLLKTQGLSDEHKITVEDVREINRQFDWSRQDSRVSLGAFLQWFEDRGQYKAVVNGTFPGYGKMFSRFLHVFEPENTQMLREWNQRVIPENAIFLEDCDGSYFNANLHPPLMPFEIRIPGGHNSLNIDLQIPVTDLAVRIENRQLILYHQPSGKKVFIFDLGFQGHGGRSPLFQLLEKFTAAKYWSVHPVNQSINLGVQGTPENKDQKNVQISPRIIFEDWLVLQRKSWSIDRSQLPVKKSDETEAAYFVRVNEWRIALNIPDEVFVFVASRGGQEMLKPEQARKLRRDDYKPQYIAFKNPFLIRLFNKCAEKVPNRLKIEEMLPSSDQLLSIGDKKHVTESVIQWYNL